MKRMLLCLGVLIAAPLWAEPTPVPANTTITTQSGARLAAPEAWTQQSREQVTLFVAPEGDARVAVVDGIQAESAEAAAAAGWLLLDGTGQREPEAVFPGAARFGWETRVSLAYETSPNEKRMIRAIALRQRQLWTVVLVDGDEATLDKRGAAVWAVFNLTAPGYRPENFAGRIARPMDARNIALLTEFLDAAIRELDIPGLAFAVVDRKQILHAGGLGLRDINAPDRVDAHTRFMVASNTKGMSTLMLATLADEGKLAWDQPVTTLYPAFQLGSADTTARTLMRHLVCACTGLPSKDAEWIINTPRGTPAGNAFKLLAATQPTSGFGEVFQYNNLITTVGGLIGGHLAYPTMEMGAAYDLAMQKRVFDPIGMSDSTFSFELALAGNVARPHGFDIRSNKTARSSHDLAYSIAPYRPAGGAWASVLDMARYAQLELNEGILPSGKRLVSRANLLERRKHGVLSGDNEWYGMGLFETIVSGIPIVSHGGVMPGYQTNFFVIPDADLAAVILTNADQGGRLQQPFQRRLIELLYDAESEAASMLAATSASRRVYQSELRERLRVPADQAVVDKLSERYWHPSLGLLKIKRSGHGRQLKLILTFADWETEATTRVNPDGTTSLVSISPSIHEYFSAVIGTDDGKASLLFHDGQHEYRYLAE